MKHSMATEGFCPSAPCSAFFCSPAPPGTNAGCSSPPPRSLTRGLLDRSGVPPLKQLLSLTAARRCCRWWTGLGAGDGRLLAVGVGELDRRPDRSPGSRLLSALLRDRFADMAMSPSRADWDRRTAAALSAGRRAANGENRPLRHPKADTTAGCSLLGRGGAGCCLLLGDGDLARPAALLPPCLL